MLSVAIAVEPPAESAPAVGLAVKSCERAIGIGRCRSAQGATTSTVVAWYAVVRVDPMTGALTISFHDRSPQGVLIDSRQLAFSERDGNETRWASVGAVIAAFVAARDSATEEPAPPPPPPDPVVLEPAPEPQSAPELERGWAWNVDLALSSGSALDRGAFRWGALTRGYVGLPQTPSVLGLISLRYAERPGDLAVTWYGAGCGLGARTRAGTLSAELTGEVAFEHLQVEAQDAFSRREKASQNRFGGRLSVNAALDLSSHWAVLLGGEITAMRPSMAISVGQADVGSVPAVAYGFFVGLRFGVWGNGPTTTSAQ